MAEVKVTVPLGIKILNDKKDRADKMAQALYTQIIQPEMSKGCNDLTPVVLQFHTKMQSTS